MQHFKLVNSWFDFFYVMNRFVVLATHIFGENFATISFEGLDQKIRLFWKFVKLWIREIENSWNWEFVNSWKSLRITEKHGAKG